MNDNYLHLKVQGIVVEFVGLIPKNNLTWSPSLEGYLITTVPRNLAPDHRKIFMTPSGRFDLSPSGHLIYMSKDPNPKNLPTLTAEGLTYTYDVGTQLHLINGWGAFGMPYKYPCWSKQGNTVYLSGVMSGGLTNSSFTQLPPGLHPQSKISFRVGRGQVEILPSGHCLISNLGHIFERSLEWYSLDGIYYHTLDNRLPPRDPIDDEGAVHLQHGGSPPIRLPTERSINHSSPNQMTTRSPPMLVDHHQNFQIIDLDSKFQKNGIITEFQAMWLQPGEMILQIYRPIIPPQISPVPTLPTVFQVTNEIPISSRKTGLQRWKLAKPLQFRIGDYLGWRYPDQGTMAYTLGQGQVRWLFGNPQSQDGLLSFTVGEPRKYHYQIRTM